MKLKKLEFVQSLLDDMMKAPHVSKKTRKLADKLLRRVLRCIGAHTLGLATATPSAPVAVRVAPKPAPRNLYTYLVALENDAVGYVGGTEGMATYTVTDKTMGLEILELVNGGLFGSAFEFTSIKIAGEEKLPRGVTWPGKVFDPPDGIKRKEFAGILLQQGDQIMMRFRNTSPDQAPLNQHLIIKVRTESRGA